jgi:serine/threonine-protein kinase
VNGFTPKKFGNYLLLDHLVDGGMAEIYRAKYLNKKANKIVALKMIKSSFLENEEFVKMFANEAEVSFKLIHSNIAQTYDVGMVDKDLYIVMEYVNGQTLRNYSKRLHESGNCIFPVEISCYIMSQVCRGLSYAHNFTDMLTGKKNVIIHRDMTPANIMLSYDGEVKIIDFGIAKAETQSTETTVGTVKGNISYLGPEYIEGKAVDHRYDIYVCGITFWEMLCGRRLFDGDNHVVVIKKIIDGNIPAPSSVNPAVPMELDEIVLKALQTDPANRYADMDEFNRKITKFLNQKYPDFNSADVSRFAQDVFKQDIASDKEKIMEFMKIDIAEYIDNTKSDDSGSLVVPKKEGNTALQTTERDSAVSSKLAQALETADRIASKTALSSEQIKGVTSRLLQALDRVSVENRKRVKKQRKEGFRWFFWFSVKVSLAVLLVGSIVGFSLFDIEEIGKFSAKYLNKEMILKQYSSVVEKSLPNFFSNLMFWNNGSAWDGELKGFVAVANLQNGDRIHFDGVEREFKGGVVKVPLERNIKVKIFRPGKKPNQEKIRLTEKEPKLRYMIPEMAGMPTGKLVNSERHPDGSILTIFDVDGFTIKEHLPLKNPFPLPEGTYKAKVENKGFGYERNIDIVIKIDQTTKIP